MDPATLVGASFAFFAVYAVLTIVFHLYFAYGLQMIADSQEQPELARVLAWIPGLQVYTLVRCGGGRFGTFLLLFVGGGLAMLALGAVAAGLGVGSSLFALLPPLWALALLGYFLAVNWRLAERQGFSGAFSLLLLLPLINLVAWWMLAYREGFRPVQKVGLVLGLLLVAAPMVPVVTMLGSGGPMALAMAQAAGQPGAERGGAEVLAELQKAMEEARRKAERQAEGGAGARPAPLGSGRARGDAPTAAEPFGPEYSPEKGRCPPGSHKHGARPPQGLEQWCAREGGGGRVRHGWYVKWHENGVRAMQGSYRDGMKSGTWTRWYESGRKSVEARFVEDAQNGVMRRWNEYGRMTREVLYRDGEPVGAPAS